MPLEKPDHLEPLRMNKSSRPTLPVILLASSVLKLNDDAQMDRIRQMLLEMENQNSSISHYGNN